jgi:hypothetical protein
MDSLTFKKERILEQERNFARDLAKAVIELPKLSIWMILIPIILVYHMYRYNQAVKARLAFVDHYLVSRSRSLDEAAHALAERRRPRIDGIVTKAVDLPDSALPAYQAWISVLIRHYGDLLRAAGTEYREFIHMAYQNRMNFLLFLNQQNQLEKNLNAALGNHVAESAQDVVETIARIEACSAELRRLQAEVLFP